MSIQTSKKSKKFYCLDMFPYPSGDGLHVGHIEGYTATDIYSRFLKLNGYEVLHPMGWDAFGLPAENYAIKTGTHPKISTAANIARFKEQMEKMGFKYDWENEINTTDPEYYKWTQWIFLQLYKEGLAYQADVAINYCPSCQTGLANEEVIAGRCERCNTPVTRKKLRQWILAITQYAERLLKDVEALNWPESVKQMQRNWIGQSRGAEVIFPLKNKYRIVYLHGFRSTPDNGHNPWLKTQLETFGHEVFLPQLPGTDQPTEQAQVEYVLNNVDFDEDTILVGHSLGGVVALKVAEKLKTRIAGLVLIASFTKPEFKDHDRPFTGTFDWNFDFEIIKQNTRSIKILQDVSDSVIPVEAGEAIQRQLGGELIKVTAEAPHFDAKVEPAVLEVVLPNIKVFTTRPDTLFGATYMVLAPEHRIISNLKNQISNISEVEDYIKISIAKTDLERTDLQKVKTGVELKGVNAINPVNGEEIPVWIADYVLENYGTGAIMAVPAHDDRDWQFAKQYNLEIREVVSGGDIKEKAFVEPNGQLVNSGEFNGLSGKDAIVKITSLLETNGLGKQAVNYKLRDWIFSRQRYWGEPIPIIHCPKCGPVPVPEDQLPVKLPEVEKYEPTGSGDSPLASIADWVNTTCPKCSGSAKRETNTMPQWAGSCWYYLRFIDPHNQTELADKTKLAQWLPIDLYIGGAEHAVLHLLYARFWHKFLCDIGAVPKIKLPSSEVSDEPFYRLFNQGIILGPDHEKMSKSRGNVVNPDSIIDQYGADALRLYEMFMGPLQDVKAWNTAGINGLVRFLNKVRALSNKLDESAEEIDKRLFNKVTCDIETINFNTAISSLMIITNQLGAKSKVNSSDYKGLLVMLSVFAPQTASTLWQELGFTGQVEEAGWPKYKTESNKTAVIAVQIDGKTRGSVTVEADAGEDQVLEIIKSDKKLASYLINREISRKIYKPNRIISLITRSSEPEIGRPKG